MSMQLSAVMNLNGDFLSQMQRNISAVESMQSAYRQTTVLADEFQSGNYRAAQSVQQVVERVARPVTSNNVFRSMISEANNMNTAISGHLNSIKDKIFNMKNLVVGAIAGITTNKLFTETIGNSAAFEQYQNAFEVMLGSADKAKAKIKELSDYANTTPFELPEIITAGRTLMTFGLDTEKWIKNAGNLASATNAQISDVARAMGNINSGNFGEAFERMRDFGISRKMLEAEGLKFDKSGSYVGTVEAAMAAVDKIVNAKFGGMTEKQATSFNGLMSTFADGISAMGRQIGDVAFPKAKDALIGLMTTFNQLNDNGAITAFAEKLGGSMSKIAESIPKVIQSIMYFGNMVSENKTKIEAALVSIGAGWIGLQTVMVSTKIVTELTKAKAAVMALEEATMLMKANAAFTSLFGFGAQGVIFIAVLMAIAAAAVLIYKNWEPIKKFFSDLWTNFISTAERVKNEALDKLEKAFNSAKESIQKHEGTIKSVATTLAVIFGPALVRVGIQAVVSGAQIAGSLIASIARVGATAVLSGIKLTASFVASLVRVSAQAVVTGARLTASLIATLIKTGAQALITAGIFTGQMILALIRFSAQGWATVVSIAAMTTAWVAQKAIMLASVTVTGLMTAAQWALNTAFYGCPVVWIIAAIMAIIAVGVLLYTHWDEVKAKALELWNSIKEKFEQFKNFGQLALQWGSDMIDGFIQGIKDKIGKLEDSVKEIANTIKSYLHFSVPDVGPLTDYETWMPDFMKGMGDGIRVNTHLVTDPIKDLSSGIRTTTLTGIHEPINQKIGVGSNSKSISSGASVRIDKLADSIVIREDADIDKIANLFVERLRKEGLKLA